MYVTNITKFTGNYQKIMEAIKGENSLFDFNKVISVPDDIKTKLAETNNIFLLEEVWGSASNAFDVKQLEVNTLLYFTMYYTPSLVLKKIAEENPDIVIEHIWDSNEQGYETGEIFAKNGICNIYQAESWGEDAYNILKRMGRTEYANFKNGYIEPFDIDRYVEHIEDYIKKGKNDTFLIKPITKF
jgi:hypothetical protein